MGNYINNAPHKRAVRAIQMIAYLVLLGVLATVVIFIAYSLKDHNSGDSYMFFITIVSSLLGSALHSAVGISLPHSGKFEFYKIPAHAFIISDIIGVVYGLKTLTSNLRHPEDLLPMIFYLTFFLGLLVSNIIILRFYIGSVSRKTSTVFVTVTTVLILLHMADILYYMFIRDNFEDSLPSKNNMIKLACNSVFLLTSIASFIVIRIKPKEHYENDPLKFQ